MAAITKVSDITVQNLADRLRETLPTDTTEFDTMLYIAKNYISSYTGLPLTATGEEKDIDDYPDFVYAVYVLCQDMYDNGKLYISNSESVNKVISSIMNKNAVNFL